MYCDWLGECIRSRNMNTEKVLSSVRSFLQFHRNILYNLNLLVNHLRTPSILIFKEYQFLHYVKL